MRPYVIMHNSISADGRIDWFKGDPQLYYSIAADLGIDATITGADTLLSGGESDDISDVPTEKMEGAGWLIVTDSKGRVKNWPKLRKYPWWSDIIVLCSRRTPKAYIGKLKEDGIEHIITGDEQVDLHSALETLSERYGVKRIRTDSGGTLNGALLRQDLVDEIILIINPYFVGGTSPKGCYRAPDLDDVNGVIDLKLERSRRLKGGAVLLHYAVRHK